MTKIIVDFLYYFKLFFTCAKFELFASGKNKIYVDKEYF